MAYKKIDQYDQDVTEGLLKNYKEALRLLGEDPAREGLEKTPERVAKAMQFLTQGYHQDANAILNSAKFHEEVSEMIIVKDMALSKGYKISDKEISELFTEKEMRSIVPATGTFFSFTKMTFDNNKGGMLEFEQTIEQLDQTVFIRMVQFIFVKGTKMYVLQGSVGSLDKEVNLALEMRVVLPLYKLIANSIVINDQYK